MGSDRPPVSEEFVDPSASLDRLYEQGLGELQDRLGRPRTIRERLRFNRERRRLARDVYGRLPRLTNW